MKRIMYGALVWLTAISVLKANEYGPGDVEVVKGIIPVVCPDEFEDQGKMEERLGDLSFGEIVRQEGCKMLFPRLLGMETPHVDWASPLSGKRLKVYFMVPSGAERFVLEMCERMDVDGRFQIMIMTSLKGSEKTQDLALQIAKERLEGCDVALIYGDCLFAKGTTDKRLAEMILEKVKKGMGLVYLVPTQGNRQWDKDQMEWFNGELGLDVGKPQRVDEPAGTIEVGDHRMIRGIPWPALPDLNGYWIASGIGGKFEAVAKLKNLPKIGVGTYGAGRVVVSSLGCSHSSQNLAPSLFGVTEERENVLMGSYGHWWEYYYGAYIKAILYAGGADPLSDFECGYEKEMPALGNGTFTLKVSGSRPSTIRVVVRDREGRVEHEGEISGRGKWKGDAGLKVEKGGNGAHVLTVSCLGVGGWHYLECIAKDKDGRVLNFGTYPFKVKPAVEMKVTSEPWSFAKETGEADVTAVIKPSQDVPKGKIVFELTDSFGRLCEIRTQDVSLKQGQEQAVQERLPIRRALGIVNEISVRIETEGRVVEKVKTTVYRPMTKWDDFVLTNYGGYGNYGIYSVNRLPHLSKLYWDIFYENGYRAGYGYLGSDFGTRVGQRDMACANLGVLGNELGWFTGCGGFYGDGGYPKKYALEHHSRTTDKMDVCLTSPVFWKDVYEKMERCKKEFLPKYGALAILLGDEPLLGPEEVSPDGYKSSDICRSPTCLAHFREQMKIVYGTIDALNKTWETSFADFDSVIPAMEDEAVNSRTTKGWLDFRMTMDQVYADYFGRVEKTLGVRSGQSAHHPCAFTSPVGGLDPERLASTGSCQLPYNNYWVEMFKSFNPECKMSTLTKVALQAGPHATGFAGWDNLFSGCDGLNIYENEWYVTSAMGYRPSGKALYDQTRSLTEGIGKMILTSQRLDDGIKIHVSKRGEDMMQIVGKRVLPDQWGLERLAFASIIGIREIVRDCQLQAGFISTQQILAGGLKGQKLLVLPSNMSLSDAEIAAIRQFAEAGGVVVADLLPAAFDEHGVPRDTADDPAAKLFGCYREKLTLGIAPAPYLCGAHVKEGRADWWFWTPLFESSLKLCGGKACGTHWVKGSPPAVVVNTVGKGKTIVLNFWLNNYTEKNPVGRWHQAYREMLMDIADMAGIQRNVTVRESDLSDAQDIAVVRFQNGRVDYAGVQKTNPSQIPFNGYDWVMKTAPSRLLASFPITIEFRRKGHVYDVREGKYLGEISEVATTIMPAESKLYAVLPYKVAGLILNVADSCERGRDLALQLTVDVKGEKAENHTLRIEVDDPGGKRVTPYCRNEVAVNGRYEGVIPFAANDMPGLWKVSVKDIMSGQRVEKPIRLK